MQKVLLQEMNYDKEVIKIDERLKYLLFTIYW